MCSGSTGIALSPFKVISESARVSRRRWYHANRAAAKVAAKKWRDANRGKIRSYARKYRAENREKMLERARAYAAANPMKVRAHALRTRYGITSAQYEQMLMAQGGLCAICQQPEVRRMRGKVTRLAVDHDHQSGRVRGLLCALCNATLHKLERHGPVWVSAALKYLEAL